MTQLRFKQVDLEDAMEKIWCLSVYVIGIDGQGKKGVSPKECVDLLKKIYEIADSLCEDEERKEKDFESIGN